MALFRRLHVKASAPPPLRGRARFHIVFHVIHVISAGNIPSKKMRGV